MKSKTKTILIFAAILAAVFLIAFLDGGAVQSAADEEEEGMLIGAFVSEEDLDIGGDLAVSAAGKFVWKAGRLYMDTDEDWWALKDRGSGIYCTMEPDSRYGEEDAKSPCITIFGALGAPLGKAGIDDDNGVRTTDINLSGEVYACGDRQVIPSFPTLIIHIRTTPIPMPSDTSSKSLINSHIIINHSFSCFISSSTEAVCCFTICLCLSVSFACCSIVLR